jgi:hypothetical protein
MSSTLVNNQNGVVYHPGVLVRVAPTAAVQVSLTPFPDRPRKGEMFPFAGRSISPQTERKDVSRETSSLSIAMNPAVMPEVLPSFDLRLTRPGLGTPWPPFGQRIAAPGELASRAY